MSLWDHAAILHRRSRSEKKTDCHHYVIVRLRRTDMHCVQLICIESREVIRKQIDTCHCETMQLICIHLGMRRKQIVTCYWETLQMICIYLKVRRKQTVTCHCETMAENRLLHVTVRHSADLHTSRSEKKTNCYIYVTVRPCSWCAYI